MPKRFKVLLLQLPFPLLNRSANEQLSTIPLAAGYLKASAIKEGLGKHCDIQILGLSDNEFSGDALLLEKITRINPDLVGFSLYVWNINRSLYIIRELKKRLSQVKVVVGGPGLTQEHSFVGRSAADIAVIAEGEKPFVGILRHFLQGTPRLDDIKGICYSTVKGKACTGAAQLLADVNDIPSPYLSGCLDPGVYKRIWIETMRFCVYKCKYCLYPARSLRKNPYFLPRRVEAEIAFAKKRGVNIVDLHDSAFNLSPHFNRLADSLQRSNRAGKMKLKVFLRAELVSPQTVRQLLKCNVVGAEVGLQSTDPQVLKNIGRSNDLDKFLRGVRLLKQAGIGVLVDIMVGLPGDSLKTIGATVNFLKKHGLDKSAAFTILSVCPSTPLWKEKKKLGLCIQRNPPYYVLSTPTLSFGQIKKAIELCTRQTVSKLHNSILHPKNNAFFPFMYTYSTGKYPAPEQLSGAIAPGCFFRDDPLTTLIFSFPCRFPGRLKLIAGRLKDKLANNVVVWFKSPDISREASGIKILLRALSRSNPYTIWHVVLETPKPPAAAVIEKIEKSIFYRINHWDYQNVFARQSLDKEYKRQAARIVVVVPEKVRCRIPAELAQIMRGVYIADGYRRTGLARVLRSNDAGILLDFSPQLQASDIMGWLKILGKDKSDKIIRFKNRLLQTVWDSGFSDLSVCSPGWSDLIYSYGPALEESRYCFTGEGTKFDAIDWKLSLGGRI